MIEIDSSAYIAPGAFISGNVKICKGVGIWPNASIRGDAGQIVIGENSNIQDCCAVHCEPGKSVVIGKNVTIGHGAVVHGPKIGDNCIIGMNSVILDDAEVGGGSIIGASAMVKSGMKIPPNSLVLGVPAQVVKQDERLAAMACTNAEIYCKLAQEYRERKVEVFRR